MDFLTNLLVLAHLLGMACLVGGWVALRLRGDQAGPLTGIVWGARMQVVTGLALVGIHEAQDHDVNHAKIGVKLVVALACAACAEIGAARIRKRGAASSPLVDGAGALAILNTAVASLWQTSAAAN